jgi:hypothetical protein
MQLPTKILLRTKMSPLLFFFLVLPLLLESKAKAIEAGDNCSLITHQITGKIGGVINYSSRLGKEQKVAMEMAVEDYFRSSCSKQLTLQLEDSGGDSSRVASASKALYLCLLTSIFNKIISKKITIRNDSPARISHFHA